jgi:hypothetical protein
MTYDDVCFEPLSPGHSHPAIAAHWAVAVRSQNQQRERKCGCGSGRFEGHKDGEPRLQDGISHWKLTVRVHGTDIEGSPFNVVVSPAGKWLRPVPGPLPCPRTFAPLLFCSFAGLLRFSSGVADSAV